MVSMLFSRRKAEVSFFSDCRKNACLRLSEGELNLTGRFRRERLPVIQSVTVFKSNKSLINGGWMPEAVSLKTWSKCRNSLKETLSVAIF